MPLDDEKKAMNNIVLSISKDEAKSLVYYLSRSVNCNEIGVCWNIVAEEAECDNPSAIQAMKARNHIHDVLAKLIKRKPKSPINKTDWDALVQFADSLHWPDDCWDVPKYKQIVKKTIFELMWAYAERWDLPRINGSK